MQRTTWCGEDSHGRSPSRKSQTTSLFGIRSFPVITCAALIIQVSTGELSSDAGELEIQLTSIFRAASVWETILLIDEADVFLQQRTADTLERNRLVGIFLRKLEYFDGILILTTNRVHDIDSAILDRMHLQIPYLALDKTAKKVIFASVLEGLCGDGGIAGLGANMLDRLTALPVNGRQVRHVTTRSLSSC